MPQPVCEMFAHFVYGPELSYHELMEREDALKLLAEEAFFQAGGEHLHFEPTGDTLRARCVLPAHGEDLFQSICEKLLPLMDEHVEGRLLFVSKDLSSLYLYALSRGAMREACLGLPAAGPLGEELLRGGR